jgi:dihydroorotase-like cyclic amidohydrolase
VIDVVVRNVRPVLADGTVVDADVLVSDGRIEGLVARGNQQAAHDALDGGGRLLLPGLIDTHVHIGFYDVEREERTETATAALGGVTTILRYFRALKPYDEIFPLELERARANSHVDYGFHLGVLVDEHLASIERYIERWGVRSFKMYTCYKGDERVEFGLRGQDDGFILDVFRRLATLPGTLPIVHSENNDIVERETMRLAAQGQGDAADLVIWEQARPEIAEIEAVQRVALLAEEAGCPLFLPHVSSARALRLLAQRKAHGQPIYVETLISFLGLDHSAPAGGLATVNPPVRAAGNSEALWDGVRRGQVDVVATDHCPTPRGRKHAGAILGCASGHPGLGTLLAGLLSEGVNRDRIDIGVVARLQARAAELFGLSTKGAIRPGADADLVLVDLDAERDPHHAELPSIAGYTPFDGLRLRGWPVWTMLRGRIIAREGRLLGAPGYGGYLRRVE